MIRIFIFILLGAIVSPCGSVVHAASEKPIVIREALGVPLYAPDAVAAVLVEKPQTPLFNTSIVKEFIDLFEASWRHGLNPETYRLTLLSTKLHEGKDAVDVLLLDSLGRYIHDLTGMRIAPKSLDLRKRDWREGIKVDEGLRALLAAPDPAAWLESLPPRTPLYKALQKELVALKEILEAGKGGEAIYPFPSLKRLLRPGDTNPAIADLRMRLGVQPPLSGNDQEYDERLAQTVMEFQRNHGLKDDGIIGPKTIGFFNQTHLDRYRQVIANLERVRWLDPEKPEKYIVVNIPAATLWAVSGGEVKAEMPVIVGRKKRPTAQFRTKIRGVRFNPEWTVPEVIKKEDFLPELLKNASFLNEKGVEVWKGEGEDAVRIDPAYVDWKDLDEDKLKEYRMIQPSGKDNALGRIRILMPNPFDIYLHDTNTPEYFRDDDRTISSGCIRLSDPEKVADFVLSGNESWTRKKMDTILESEKLKEISVSEPFPVIILYQTAWLKKDGNLVFAYDVYEEDIRLFDALKKQGLVPDFSSSSVP